MDRTSRSKQAADVKLAAAVATAEEQSGACVERRPNRPAADKDPKMVYSRRSVVYGVQSMVYSIWCIVYGVGSGPEFRELRSLGSRIE